jgi:hypothetical protein
MIAIYRGYDTGLAGQSTKSLLGLLKYYEVRISRFIICDIVDHC